MEMRKQEEQMEKREEKEKGTGRVERQRKPGRKRLALTLSVAICFVIGIPLWLKSTEVYRTHLPYEAIHSLSTSPMPRLPCQFNILLLNLNSQIDTEDDSALKHYLQVFTSLVSQQLKNRTNENDQSGCGSDYIVTASLDWKDKCVSGTNSNLSHWPCGLSTYLSSVDISSSDDDEVDELLNSYSQRESGGLGGVYTVLVAGNGNAGSHSYRCVIGKHRHAWIVGELSETDVVALIGEIVGNYFIKGGNMIGNKAVSMPLAADGSATLSFSLLNANPADWIYQWDFEKLEKRFLMPLVEMLAPVATLVVESQVLYHSPKATHSYWDEQLASYVLHVNDLPFFVNSNEWHLDTSVAAAGRSKILQFAIYIPSALECPLTLKLPNGEISATNGFISPGWGGIIVLNPLSCISSTVTGKHYSHEFNEEEFGPVMQVIVGQIRMLLGLPPTAPHDSKMHILSVLASQTGFSDWQLNKESIIPPTAELQIPCHTLPGGIFRMPTPTFLFKSRLHNQRYPRDPAQRSTGLYLGLTSCQVGVEKRELDVLLRRRVVADVASCSLTLASLSRLVKSLPSMVIKDEIGDQIYQSLEAASLARNNSFAGMYLAAAEFARKARNLAEEAFFQPSIMSLLYFPIEHHFAIYTPFFVPVLLHTFLAATKEVIRYHRESKVFLRSNMST